MRNRKSTESLNRTSHLCEVTPRASKPRIKATMTSIRLSLLFLALWTVSFAKENEDQQKLVTTKSPTQKTTVNISTAESNKNISTTAITKIKSHGGFSMDSEMIQRALYVLIGITAIGVLYFLVRAVRLKKTTVQRRKYGLLSNYDDTMEMTHLESDEDDNTVYEARSLRR